MHASQSIGWDASDILNKVAIKMTWYVLEEWNCKDSKHRNFIPNIPFSRCLFSYSCVLRGSHIKIRLDSLLFFFKSDLNHKNVSATRFFKANINIKLERKIQFPIESHLPNVFIKSYRPTFLNSFFVYRFSHLLYHVHKGQLFLTAF